MARASVAQFDSLNQLIEAREKETLNLYRPTPQQIAVHQSGAFELCVRGGKRSGKSVSVAIEFVSRILGQSVIDPDGNPFPLRFRPSTKRNPGLYWIIGWAVNHIGQTIHRLLFEPGLFRIIKDQQTGKWRVFQDADPADIERFDESENAPALIPPRMIDAESWSWENKGANQFESVKLIDGTIIRAYPSSSRHAKMGDAVSGIWIDEDVQFAAHVKEWQDRLTTKNGWLIWSVWPHRKNYALVDMIDRADEQKLLPRPKVQQVQLVMSQNPFIARDAVQNALDRMGSETEIALRDRGELLWEELMMYEFLPLTHIVRRRQELGTHCKVPKDVIEQHLARYGRMPPNWTRYLVIDPSHTRTAVLIGAVAPSEEFGIEMGNVLVIEKEIIAKRVSAPDLASLIAKETNGLTFEAFIMDQNAGRQTWAGREDSTSELYTKAFEAKNLKSRLTGATFLPGCNVPTKRFASVRTMLAVNARGRAQVYFYDHKTPETQREFDTYRKKQSEIAGEEVILDEPANPRKHDCMAAVEYLCEYIEQQFEAGTAFVAPENQVNQGSGSYKAAQALKASFAKQQGGSYVHLGPGAAA